MNQDTSDNTNKLWTPLVGLTLAVGLVHIYFLFRTNINWDEFRFLAEIYEFAGGRDSAGLNNFHVLLYGWLRFLPFHEIDQILFARTIQLSLFFASMVLLFRFGREFFSPIVALTCVFLAMCYSAVLLHASAFRFDPLCLFFSISSLYLLWRGKRPTSAIVGGLALAVSALVSVKTALWAPTLAAIGLIMLVYSEQRTETLKRLVLFVAAFLLAVLCLFGLHWLLSGSGTPGNQVGTHSLTESWSQLAYAMFVMDGLFPRLTYIIRGVTENPIHWLLILAGATIAVYQVLFVWQRRKQAAIVLAMSLPLLSVVFYRNSFPYFYVYALPPAILLCGIALNSMARRWMDEKGNANDLALGIPILCGVATTSLFLYFHEEGITKQRQVNEVIHEIFPEPVHYIGAHGMISSFPKVGPFMSTLGMIRYHAEKEPVFANAIQKHEPKFLLVNHMAFYSPDDATADDLRQVTLLPEDKDAIHNNYIHHWGPIYVAGKLFDTAEQGNVIEFEIVIEGPYGVESESPVEINGLGYDPGDVVTLARGTYVMKAPDTERAGLRWGGNLPQPEYMAPMEWLYDGL